jgi:hypothetical protein
MLTISSYKGNANQNLTKIHLTAVRIAIIKNITNNMCWQGCGEKGTCHILLVGMQTGATTLEKKIWRLLKNLNIDCLMILQSHSWGYMQRNVTQFTP